MDLIDDLSEGDPLLEEGADAPKNIPVRSHLEPDKTDECAYCGQAFGPDEVAIEREILGRKWRFCSEECLRDFRDASDFKDQDLDGDKDDLNATVDHEEPDDDPLA